MGIAQSPNILTNLAEPGRAGNAALRLFGESDAI